MLFSFTKPNLTRRKQLNSSKFAKLGCIFGSTKFESSLAILEANSILNGVSYDVKMLLAVPVYSKLNGKISLLASPTMCYLDVFC